MSASVSSPVSSTLHFQAQASAFASAASDRAPAPLATLRAAGAEAFARLGFPTTRSEDWKYTSVSSIANTPFARPRSKTITVNIRTSPSAGEAASATYVTADARQPAAAQWRSWPRFVASTAAAIMPMRTPPSRTTCAAIAPT